MCEPDWYYHKVSLMMLEDHGITAAVVYAVIANNIRWYGICDASAKYIADNAGTTVYAVKRAIPLLIRQGYVIDLRKKRQANYYFKISGLVEWLAPHHKEYRDTWRETAWQPFEKHQISKKRFDELSEELRARYHETKTRQRRRFHEQANKRSIGSGQ